MEFGLIAQLIKTANNWNKISNLSCINTVRLNYLINLCKYKSSENNKWSIEAYVEDDNTGNQLFVHQYEEGTTEFNLLNEIYDKVFTGAKHIWGEYNLLKEEQTV